ncbi:MAG: sodium/proline symporter [Gammaproteobacteria bacterium]|nr:sodium/proline symporter [Gammaproteobacteria bacterium]NNL99177.1 sodium/proline symporter [Gammaproteobacteria bacterium]
MTDGNATAYLVLLAYLALLLAIGVVAARRIHSISDYYVAGGRLGYWVAAFSARATGESGWLLLGLTGLGAMAGLSAMWVVVGEVLGVAIAWFLMAGPFRRATDRAGALTIPDYLAARHGSGDKGSDTRGAAIRVVAALAIAIFVTVYISAQIDATGKAFESFLDIDYYTGVLIGFGIVVFYTCFGGFFAVAWSDLLQGTLMLAGLVILPIAAWAAAPGLGSILAGLNAADPALLSIWGAPGFSVAGVLIAISYVAIGLGFLGSPQIFVRFIAIRDQAEIDKGRWVAVAFTVLTTCGAVLSGMFGRYLLVGPEVVAETVLGPGLEMLLPVLVGQVLPAAVAALFIAVVLAAIMSTVDSLLVVASSALTRDLYQQLLHPAVTPERITRLSRIVTLLLAFTALAIALAVAWLVPGRTVFWFAIFGWSGIAATFCPAIVLSLFWPAYGFAGAIVSMLTGFISIPLFKFLVPGLGEWGRTVALAGELAPAFLISLAAGALVTFLAAAPAPGSAACPVSTARPGGRSPRWDR